MAENVRWEAFRRCIWKDGMQHTMRSRLQPEALVSKKYYSLYSKVSSRLNSSAFYTQIFNLNKAALKPCTSEQKSKVRR